MIQNLLTFDEYLQYDYKSHLMHNLLNHLNNLHLNNLHLIVLKNVGLYFHI